MTFHSHVAILAFPFGTHAAPLFALVRRLAASARGTLFSFFNSPVSNAGLFNGPGEQENIHVHDVWDGTPKNGVFTGSHFEAVGLFLKASPGNFEKEIEKAESESGLKIGCLITDAFLWFGGDMAEGRGVPWLAFWTAASCSLSAHVYTDEIVKVVGSAGTNMNVIESFEHLNYDLTRVSSW
ncbi:UDP-glycosyltransferase 78D2 [Striga hermonthica]|uniref:UDP-glycosyltransferase 78D2 n=1 Tax=Striga hermonthica TaxID=68872 RepID=A0A9N7R3I0_STRHE|nr:UDP-glycosyltransferase 78D2 [Striga hermonthica]